MTRLEKIGWIENVSFPKLGISLVEAKVDTGAYSGALHATNMKVLRRGIGRKKVLKFYPNGDERHAQETEDFIETYVRSATGHRVKRYIIDTVVRIHDRDYPIRIGLSERSGMKRPVLIGRRFIRENNILVDVRINQELDVESENTR